MLQVYINKIYYPAIDKIHNMPCNYTRKAIQQKNEYKEAYKKQKLDINV